MRFFKKISVLFLIVFIACGAGEEDIEVTENTSSNSDEPTTTTEQQKKIMILQQLLNNKRK